jgi:acyl-CoA reductase-like NAD-dependent aldehyde dehydrogenase
MRVGGVIEDHSLIEVVDPAREERISVFEAFGEAQIEAALADAHAAQLQWRAAPITALWGPRGRGAAGAR